MKTTLLTLCWIIGMQCPGWALNATNSPLPPATDDIFIGQDPETGDEIMSAGSGNDENLEETAPETVIITPEIIWPPQRQHNRRQRSDHPRPDHPRINPGTTDPHSP